MSNKSHRTFVSESNVKWGGSKVRQVSFSDISPEIVMEALTRMDVRARVTGKAPRASVLSCKFRKRLANVKEA